MKALEERVTLLEKRLKIVIDLINAVDDKATVIGKEVMRHNDLMKK